MTSNFPDSWGPYFFLGITKAGGSEVQYASIVDLSTLEWNEGDFPGEGLPNGAGGRVWKEMPAEDSEVSFEVWEQELALTGGVGLGQLFHGSADATEPLSTGTAITASVARSRDRFRLVVLFTNDPAATAAGSATGASTDSFGFVLENARFISRKPTMSDGVLKTPVTFKAAYSNKAGTQKNLYERSGDQTALPALGAFT